MVNRFCNTVVVNLLKNGKSKFVQGLQQKEAIVIHLKQERTRGNGFFSSSLKLSTARPIHALVHTTRTNKIFWSTATQPIMDFLLDQLLGT